jgi:hypothetical protein
MSQLQPIDILIIQNAIEDYKRRYPRRETPSADAALAWRAGHRGRRKMRLPKKREAEPALQRSFLERLWVWCLHA